MEILMLRNPSDDILANLNINVVEGQEIDLADPIAEELLKLKLAEQIDE